MLTPRLRRRLSELARAPAPPSSWAGTRGGACPAPPPASALLYPLPASEATPPPQHPTPNTEYLFLMPFDPPSLGGETETELGRCFRLSLAIADHLEDAAARAERLRAAAARLKVAPEALLFVDIETAGLTAAPLFLIGVLSLGVEGLTLTQYLARGY